MFSVAIKSLNAQDASSERRDLGFLCPTNNEFVPNMHVIKQVVNWHRSKQMSGTHKVKNISEVSGTGKKPYKQKGTGRARAGSLRAVQMRGGCVVHGPRVRDRSLSAPPKKIRRLALLSAIANKVREEKILVMQNFEMDKPSTKVCSGLLKALNIKSALFCIDIGDENFALSVRNIPNSKVALYPFGLNTYDIIKYDFLIVSNVILTKLENAHI